MIWTPHPSNAEPSPLACLFKIVQLCRAPCNVILILGERGHQAIAGQRRQAVEQSVLKEAGMLLEDIMEQRESDFRGW